MRRLMFYLYVVLRTCINIQLLEKCFRDSPSICFNHQVLIIYKHLLRTCGYTSNSSQNNGGCKSKRSLHHLQPSDLLSSQSLPVRAALPRWSPVIAQAARHAPPGSGLGISQFSPFGLLVTQLDAKLMPYSVVCSSLD